MIVYFTTIENEKIRNKLQEIYMTYYRDMYITAYSILKDHHAAEDVVQETILRLYNKLDKIPEVKCKKTRAYLVIITRNLSYDAYNKRKGVVLLEHEEVKGLPDTDEIFIEEQLLKTAFSSEMSKYIKRLHPSYADILTLRFYYELDIKEISEMLGVTENNVSVRIHRALKAVKKIIEKGGDYGRTVKTV